MGTASSEDPGEEAGSLVEVGLRSLTLDGGVERIYIFLRMKPLCVLNCVMGLQIDKKWEFTAKMIKTNPASGASHPRAAPMFNFLGI